MKATKYSQFLQNRETLKFTDSPHWIYLVEAAIWACLIIAFGLFANSFIANNFIYPRLANNLYADGLILNIAAYAARIVLWGSIVFGILYFLNRAAFWASTKIFASDRRLYMKTGLIRVLVNEVSFEEIRQTDINYGFLGRFLGYGKLMMDARFVEDSELPFIYHPEKFIKLIHYSNDLASDINISYVTDNMTKQADKIVPKQSEVDGQVKPMRQQQQYASPDPEGDEGSIGDMQSNASDDELNDFRHVAKMPDKHLDKPAKHDPKPIQQ